MTKDSILFKYVTNTIEQSFKAPEKEKASLLSMAMGAINYASAANEISTNEYLAYYRSIKAAQLGGENNE